MNCDLMNALKRLVVFCLLSNVFLQASAQDGQHERPNVPIGTNCNGYLEYLPTGYTGGTAKYPLLLNILGFGTEGNGSQSSLDFLYGIGGGNPHEQAKQGTWQEAYTVGGNTFKFVVITPQFMQPMISHTPTPTEVDAVITYMVQHYRIDTSRIYLIGSSQGAGAVWDYIGGGSQYAKRIAAAIPFAGVSFPFQEKANIMKFGKVAVWAFHNDLDASVPSSFTKDYVNFYNNAPTPFFLARKTIFPGPNTSHLCWFAPLRREYTENGQNVYEWLLQYHKDPTTAEAGNDQEIVLPANAVNLSSNGVAPNGTAASYHWEKFYGPLGANPVIATPNSATTSVTGLSQGSYLFKVTIAGTDGSTANDLVAITVNPTQQRIQAEAYSSSIGPVNTFIPNNDSLFVISTIEADGTGSPMKVDGINYNNWINYSVTVPSSGIYKIRFRAGSGTGGNRFAVQNSSFTNLDTVLVYATGGNYDSYMNVYADVPLQAGTQTIRIQNLPLPDLLYPNWFLNWFEIIDNTPVAYPLPLPVHFLVFSANCNNGRVDLSWKTGSEENADKFIIERSSDGRTWTAIGTLAAAGQSASERTYSYTDATATDLNSFYRIAQVDFDGRKTLTSVLRASCSGKQNFSVFPNPVVDKTTLSLTADQDGQLNLSIVDAKGRIVKSQKLAIPKGNSMVNLDLADLASGMYLVQAQWNGQTQTLKLMKK